MVNLSTTDFKCFHIVTLPFGCDIFILSEELSKHCSYLVMKFTSELHKISSSLVTRHKEWVRARIFRKSNFVCVHYWKKRVFCFGKVTQYYVCMRIILIRHRYTDFLGHTTHYYTTTLTHLVLHLQNLFHLYWLWWLIFCKWQQHLW